MRNLSINRLKEIQVYSHIPLKSPISLPFKNVLNTSVMIFAHKLKAVGDVNDTISYTHDWILMGCSI